MTKFNWPMSTVEELATHIHSTTANSVKQQVNYYKLTSNNTMLARINKAKKLVTLWKLEAQLSILRQEIYS